MGNGFLFAAIVTAAVASVTAIVALIQDRRLEVRRPGVARPGKLRKEQAVVIDAVLREEWKTLADQQLAQLQRVQETFRKVWEANRSHPYSSSIPHASEALRSQQDAIVASFAAIARQAEELRRVDPPKLTEAERSILNLYIHGRSNQDVARELLVSEVTVHSTLRSIYKKLGSEAESSDDDLDATLRYLFVSREPTT